MNQKETGHTLHTRRAALGPPRLPIFAAQTRAKTPEKVNIGFFTEAKPTMIAKGEGWFAAASARGSTGPKSAAAPRSTPP